MRGEAKREQHDDDREHDQQRRREAHDAGPGV
jgi:hypothetical protein